MDDLIELESLLRNIQAAVKSIVLYPPTHPTAARFLSRILEDLDLILSERESLVLGVVDHALVAVGLPYTGTDTIPLAFAARLEERGIGSIELRRGCTAHDVSQCVEVLAMQPQALERLSDVGEILFQRGVRAIRFSREVPRLVEEAVDRDKEVWDRGSLSRSLRVYREAVGSAMRILTEARLGKIPSLAEAQGAVAGLVDGVLQDQNLMLALTLIKGYDQYLFNHSVNVGVVCIALGQSLGLDGETIKELGLGAFLHDIGKVHWPEALYQKPRGLTDAEWALVQRHPIDGAQIMEKMGNVGQTTQEVVLEHHLRYDRQGYPQLDPDKETSFFGMIAQMADTYDAITTTRVYQNAFEPSKAVAQMQGMAGTVFDPKLFEAFVRMVGIYPVGSLVRLSSGELALVMKANPTDTSRPIIRILFDRTGRRMTEEPQVDLLERDPASGQFRRSIIMAVDAATKNFDVAKYMESKEGSDADRAESPIAA